MQTVEQQFAPNIIVLEDEESWLTEIRAKLNDFPGSLRVASNFKQFRDIVRNEECDAVSVDWYIGPHEKGVEALRLVARERPEAARIVLTHDRARLDEAKLDADAVLLKDDGDYRAEMQVATRTGRARRIARELHSMGVKNMDPRSVEYPLAKPKEEEIREVARARLSFVLLQNHANAHLKELLISRGWWRILDIREFALLPKLKKLLTLSDCVGLSIVDISSILGIASERIAEVMHSNVNSMTAEDADHLLSILGYIQRISTYEPELMAHYWRIEGAFAGSSQPAPWDRLGMGQFLAAGGRKSLTAAIEWIRSH